KYALKPNRNPNLSEKKIDKELLNFDDESRKIVVEQLKCLVRLQKFKDEDIDYQRDIHEKGVILTGEIDEEKVMNGIDEEHCRGVTVSTNPKMVKDFARFLVNAYRRNHMKCKSISILLVVLQHKLAQHDKWNLSC
ncbi:unnamed protein product, partial [Amoebophrya sp. A120]